MANCKWADGKKPTQWKMEDRTDEDERECGVRNRRWANGRVGRLDGSFPLTPALSRGERETLENGKKGWTAQSAVLTSVLGLSGSGAAVGLSGCGDDGVGLFLADQPFGQEFDHGLRD